MNKIQRRLFRAFVEAGGNVREQTEVERFLGQVEATLPLLTPKVRTAVEIAWHANDTPDYARIAQVLAERNGERVTSVALRQRVSRGLRTLERAIVAQRRERQADVG